jgi:hypothetical protein
MLAAIANTNFRKSLRINLAAHGYILPLSRESRRGEKQSREKKQSKGKKQRGERSNRKEEALRGEAPGGNDGAHDWG